jgi:hypothetical protein
MKKVVLCQIAALALACASCRNNNCYPVSGKVTYHGSPASGATVYFHRQGGDGMNDHTIMGIVQEDGSFELVSGLPGKGAPPGAYDVLIEWRRGHHVPMVGGPSRGRPHQVPDVLKGRYADAKRPLLHATVEAKATNLSPFELSD